MVDNAPVLSECITAYKSQKMENMFFFNEEHLSSYQKCTSDSAGKKVPGSCYIEKIANFQKIHCISVENSLPRRRSEGGRNA